MALELNEEFIADNQGGDWYLKDTPTLAGVTNLPNNPELGINDINIIKPSQAQKDIGMVAVVYLKTIIGDIRLSVHLSTQYTDTLYLRVPQSQQDVPGQEKPKYFKEVNLTSKVQAQVLRHIHSKCVAVQGQPVGQAGGVGVGVGTVGNFTAGQGVGVGVGQPAQPQMPAITPEMMAMFAQMQAMQAGMQQPQTQAQVPAQPVAPVQPAQPTQPANPVNLNVIPEVVDGQVAQPANPAGTQPDPFSNVPVKNA